MFGDFAVNTSSNTMSNPVPAQDGFATPLSSLDPPSNDLTPRSMIPTPLSVSGSLPGMGVVPPSATLPSSAAGTPADGSACATPVNTLPHFPNTPGAPKKPRIMAADATSQVTPPPVVPRTSDAPIETVTTMGQGAASEIQTPPVVQGHAVFTGCVANLAVSGIAGPSNAQALAGQSSSPPVNAAATSSEMLQPAPGFQIKVTTGEYIESA